MINPCHKVLVLLIICFFFFERCSSQTIRKGDIWLGSALSANITENTSEEERDLEVISDIDFQYFVSDKANIGLKVKYFRISSDTPHSFTYQHEWIAGCSYQRKLVNSFFVEVNTGFGIDQGKGKTDTGFSGSHNIKISQFGCGINYYKFLTPRLVLYPCISYTYKTLFVKHLEDFNTNQHVNKIYFGIGLQYRFNTIKSFK